jgi:uncharacterized protein (TIGR02145 family)
LVKTTTEPAGVNCTTGGTKIETGIDANGNNALETSEITPGLTRYICNGAIGPAGNFPPGTSPGDIFYWTGSIWANLPIGTVGQFLKVGSSGLPVWADASGGGNLPNGVSTTSVTPFALNANSGGTVLSEGGSAITSRGVCWSTTQNPTIANFKTTDGSGIGTFSSNITGLNLTTTYYVRAYATNSNGTTYGNQQTFTTQNGVISLTTSPISLISGLSAKGGGSISADGGSTITSRGICWATTQNPTILNSKTVDGDGTGTFVSNMSSLTPNTLHYVRAYATNGLNTYYGNQLSFITLPIQLPIILTSPITDLTLTSATGGGTILDDGFGAIIARGVCWSTSQNPTIAITTKTVDGTGIGTFTSNLTGLTPATTYYLRAYATNSAGTAYGDQQTLTTYTSVFNPNLAYGTMTDIDGNTYKTIMIGTQTWMAENLKTTKYRNGNPIPTNLSNAAWENAATGAYAIYNNNATNNTIYGRLYNWYAVADSRNLCPVGWHVPSEGEWKTLEISLGMSAADADLEGTRGTAQNVGGKLKSTSTLWNTPNTGATNESGFSGLSGGYRGLNGDYINVGLGGYWWSSTEYSTLGAWQRDLSYGSGGSIRFSVYNKPNGFSVRCLKD